MPNPPAPGSMMAQDDSSIPDAFKKQVEAYEQDRLNRRRAEQQIANPYEGMSHPGDPVDFNKVLSEMVSEQTLEEQVKSIQTKHLERMEKLRRAEMDALSEENGIQNRLNKLHAGNRIAHRQLRNDELRIKLEDQLDALLQGGLLAGDDPSKYGEMILHLVTALTLFN